MPILDVELIRGAAEPERATLARRLADAAGAIFESEPGQTWVRVREIAAADYAENATDAAAAGLRPVFVRVLKRALPDAAAMTREIEALTNAVAKETGRPRDQVHVVYEPSGAGRVAFGGRLLA